MRHAGMLDLAIRNVAVVDVASGRVLHNQTIRTSGGRIEAIEPANGEPSGQAIDGTGCYAMPGMIDAHVHFFFDGGEDPYKSYLAMDREERMRVAERNAEVAIRAGITTMQDLGAPIDLWQELQEGVESGAIDGPHVISSGAPLTRPRGHCFIFGGEVSTKSEVVRLIESQRARGAHTVKVMASGGGMTPGTRPHEADFPLELMRYARDAAHANGMTITAHCHATESIERAIDAKLDVIEHVGFVEPPGRWKYDEGIAIRVRDAGIAVCPTAANGMRAARLFRKEERPHNPEDFAAVDRLEGRTWMTGEFHRLGLRVLGGSDCGADMTPFNALVDEAETFVSVGFSNSDALRAITNETASILQLGKVGELRRGYDADIILLRGNPLAEIQSLREPIVVLKAGEIMFDAR